MSDIEVLATGSKGNCYLLKSGEARILLDCGIPFKRILELLNFELPKAIFLTHEHKDHSRAASDFLKRGVDVFTTQGTAEALNLEKNHRLHIISRRNKFQIDNLTAYSFEAVHDATEPVNFFVDDGEDLILYLTDTGNLVYVPFFATTKILLETNYSEEQLKNSPIDEKQKQRIRENHLSIEQAKEYFELIAVPKLKEIFLIHISERHGDKESFGKIIQSVVDDNIKIRTEE